MIKKVVFNYDEGTLREVTLEEIEDFEELYKIAKTVDEKLDEGEYTTTDNTIDYCFNYNGETIILYKNAGSYNNNYYYEEYTFYASANFPDGECSGL